MKVNVVGCAAFALLIGTLPASANTFRARNTLTVNPITATEFEVVKKASSSPRAMWCAASDFSGRGLGRYKKTDLIIKTPIGPSVTQPGRIGVMFTIDPDKSDIPSSKSGSVTVKTAGASLSVGHAQTFCGDSISPFSRR